MANDEIEQRRHALVLGPGGVGRHPALLGRAVENREIELLLGRIERGEQVEHRIGDFGRARVGAIDLVDHDDRPQPHFERLRHHELGLRQRPLGGVDQNQCAIHHIEDALDLAAEIGVARRIDDIDPGILPNERSRLGEDGDAALALEVVRIEHAFDHPLVLAERARLLQEPVDQRGFAVVDMGDNGDVAEIHALIVKPLRAPRGPRLRAVYSQRIAEKQSITRRRPWRRQAAAVPALARRSRRGARQW